MATPNLFRSKVVHVSKVPIGYKVPEVGDAKMSSHTRVRDQPFKTWQHRAHDSLKKAAVAPVAACQALKDFHLSSIHSPANNALKLGYFSNFHQQLPHFLSSFQFRGDPNHIPFLDCLQSDL